MSHPDYLPKPRRDNKGLRAFLQNPFATEEAPIRLSMQSPLRRTRKALGPFATLLKEIRIHQPDFWKLIKGTRTQYLHTFRAIPTQGYEPQHGLTRTSILTIHSGMLPFIAKAHLCFGTVLRPPVCSSLQSTLAAISYSLL